MIRESTESLAFVFICLFCFALIHFLKSQLQQTPWCLRGAQLEFRETETKGGEPSSLIRRALIPKMSGESLLLYFSLSFGYLVLDMRSFAELGSKLGQLKSQPSYWSHSCKGENSEKHPYKAVYEHLE